MQFYYISHFLQAWLLPPGINLLIIFMGILLVWRGKKIGKSLVGMATISLWLLSLPVVSQLLIDILQNQYPVLTVKELTPTSLPGAIIVLGGGDGFAPEYEHGHALDESTMARLHYAVYLNRKLRMPIVVSGGSPNHLPHTGANLMLEELNEYFKISSHWKEDKSLTTQDEGKFMVPLLQRHGIKVAYLVTHAWHTPRAMYTFNTSFKKTKIKIIAAPMSYGNISSDSKIFNYLPTIEGLMTSTTAIHEYIGILFYYLSNLIK